MDPRIGAQLELFDGAIWTGMVQYCAQCFTVATHSEYRLQYSAIVHVSALTAGWDAL